MKLHLECACGHVVECHAPQCYDCACPQLSSYVKAVVVYEPPANPTQYFDENSVCSCGHPAYRHTSVGTCVYGNCNCRQVVSMSNVEASFNGPAELGPAFYDLIDFNSLSNGYLKVEEARKFAGIMTGSPPTETPKQAKKVVKVVEPRGERKLALDKDI